MDIRSALVMATILLATAPASQAATAAAKPAPTMDQVLKASKPSDWRTLDPNDTLYMDLPQGRVVIELAPAYAPLHAENIRTLAREHYWDGLAILRVQDGFVTQWGDPAAEARHPAHPPRALGKAKATIAPEFERAIAPDLPFTRLPDGDVYAPEVGFSRGFPVARDPKTGKTWPVHCYGMVGAGRDNAPDSGPGTELYAVIGQAPRQLDRNIALVGRVVEGMQYLAALPRGNGAMGFYDNPAHQTRILRVRLASELPPSERMHLEVLRTDTPTFTALVESRRNRSDAWYLHKAGKIDVCNVPLPVRTAPRDGRTASP
ncbi:MAG: Peptidyl-prolyl cis-trans isomerase [Rhodanobacteraceae bacterium]|jgi:peptidylprolyl isomerase|nr:MAG: Peptidyl-prolyl cis-trans isomerase [Rhodanobacteraceae bacterium]